MLQVKNLGKSFPGVKALDQVCLSLAAGEVLAVIGENGAGKSTLMKILAGVQTADEGQVLLDDKPIRLESTRAAMDRGIVLIHQELNLCDNLNVGQNIFLGREPQRMGIVDSKAIQSRSQQFLDRVGLKVSPKTIVGKLTIGRQQMVEIAKALSIDARILIMDEPTSSLSASESESLFSLIEELRDQGVAIIYISHRLAEVKRLADRVAILRDGKNAGELVGDEIHHEAMVRNMVGRDVSRFYSRSQHKIGPTVFSARKISTPAWPEQEVSFQLRAGEIVGLAGLVGAGRTELLRVLFGIDEAVGGTIEMGDRLLEIHSPQDAINNGIALVPEDRKQHGLIIDLHVRNNIGLPSLHQNQHRLGIANLPKQKSSAARMIELLGVKTPSQTQLAKYLSGGNQQKVVIGKWLAMTPKILLLDEPTRGIDIGAKQEIYQLIEKLASESMAILFVSSELEEIIGLADRVMVMHEGRMTGELERDQMNEEAIMRLATGTLASSTPSQ